MEKEVERCCGTGHCMINSEGRCWCGQEWDGEKMCLPKPKVKAEINGGAPLTSAYIASDNTPAQPL